MKSLSEGLNVTYLTFDLIENLFQVFSLQLFHLRR